MAKDLPAQVISQIDATHKRPALLFELGLSSTLRYAAYMTNITFPTAGNVYTAKTIQLSGVTQSLEGQINRISINFDDITSDMSAYADIEEFKGKSLIIKRVYIDALGDSTYYNEIFNGYMERVSSYDNNWMTIIATSGKGLNKKALNTSFQRMCPWVFGGDECNTDGNADLGTLTASGTADSGTTETLVDDALTQTNDFWNDGEIYITKSGTTYRRKVKDFNSTTDTITIDVALDFSIDNTCTYTVYKGCDKTWNTCSATYTQGPSADNSANFGGCIHISGRQPNQLDNDNTPRSNAIPFSPRAYYPPGVTPPEAFAYYQFHQTLK